MDSLQISPEDEEKELIEYEKQLRETYERDMEAFVVQVYEEIEENKKRDIQAITDEAEILADAHRMGL
uniref:Uncharacterized protein n=1 Tax=Panagrolaimus davidi TaxID=227884 RepID=A0A914R5G3_9BILA